MRRSRAIKPSPATMQWGPREAGDAGVHDCRLPMTGSREEKPSRSNGDIVRAEEGDETVKGLADEAGEAKKELKESTATGKKVQEEQEDSE